jgi:endonuclease/exonuclease/phosphatase family metal-dependent hydrolase
MKVVSFNIRCDIQPMDDAKFREMISKLPAGTMDNAPPQAKLRFPKGDGINAWNFRREAVVKKIRAERPEIIGFQELMPHMLAYMRENLNEYTFVGHGRDADYGGERPMIAVRNDLEILEFHCFWLSPTPTIPGSRFAVQSTCPRTCVVATVLLPNGRRVRVYDTHLDHLCGEAREAGLQQLLAVMAEDQAKEALPMLLMGDFNASPDMPEMQPIYGEQGQALQLRDLTTETGITFHGYGSPEDSIKIDYLFATEPFVSAHTATTLWNECENGRYLSDHYPVCVSFDLP